MYIVGVNYFWQQLGRQTPISNWRHYRDITTTRSDPIPTYILEGGENANVVGGVKNPSS